MINLKTILSDLKEVEVGIRSELFDFQNAEGLTELAIKEAIERLDNQEDKMSAHFKLIIEGEEYSFENNLHRNGKGTKYLLESRLFREETQAMIGAYLEIIDVTPNGDLIIYEPYTDDIWNFSDWQ